MGDLAERLAEELNVETVFDVPFFGKMMVCKPHIISLQNYK